MTHPNHLFVYGTLRRDYASEPQRALLRDTEFIGEATVQGQLFVSGEYSALVPMATEQTVKGEISKISPPHLQETLDELDEYEGVKDRGKPSDYRREIVVVRVAATGETMDAWSYVLNRPYEGLERIPSGDYREWRRSSSA